MKNKTLIVLVLFLIVIIGYESYIFYEGNYCDSKTNNYSDQYKNDSIVEEQKDGKSTAYASWCKYNSVRYAHFSCSDRAPMITFPDSELYIQDYGHIGPAACAYFCIDGEYIYYDSDAADAKNPELRLPIKKIK